MDKKLLLLTIILFILVMPTAIATNFSSCQTFSSSDTYTLTSNISTSSSCLIINATDVYIDCQGNTINTSSGVNGVDFLAGMNDSSLTNCRIDGFTNAIYFSGAGIETTTENVTINNNHLTNNDNAISSDTNSQNDGVYHQIYNNFFNNTNDLNIYDGGAVYNYRFWITTYTATNIVGREQIGGNYWTNYYNGGFSDTCSNSDNNSFCDSTYNIDAFDDNYPLTLVQPPPVPPFNGSITACKNSGWSAGETYTLEQNINAGSGSYCFDGFTDDVTLDCQGYTITSTGTTGAASFDADNVTIKNCLFDDFSDSYAVVHVGLSNSFTFEYNTVSDCSGGFAAALDTSGVFSTSTSYVRYNTISNCPYGVLMYGASSDWEIHDNNITNTGYSGIDLWESSGAFSDFKIYNNRVSGSGYSLSCLDISGGGSYCGMGVGVIYNNLFNSTNLYDISGTGTFTTDWNTSEASGTNVVGGPSIGGNYHGTASGGGYSDGCTDTDEDGFCDSSYTFGSFTDYLPLTEYTAPLPPPLNPVVSLITPADDAVLTSYSTVFAFSAVNLSYENVCLLMIDDVEKNWGAFGNGSGGLLNISYLESINDDDLSHEWYISCDEANSTTKKNFTMKYVEPPKPGENFSSSVIMGLLVMIMIFVVLLVAVAPNSEVTNKAKYFAAVMVVLILVAVLLMVIF